MPRHPPHPGIEPSADPSRVHRLLASQHGVASDDQLLALGLPRPALEARLRDDRWFRPCPGVVAVAGAPDTWEQRARIATLLPGRPVLGFGAALRVHGVDGFHDHEGIAILVGRGSHPEPPVWATVHSSRRLGPDDRTEVAGIPVTALATSLVHAAATEPITRLEQALDDALRRGTSVGWLQATSARWRGRGVPGSGVLADLLATRLSEPLPRSWFERLAARALAAHGVVLEHEVEVFDGRRRLAVLDLADRRWQVGVECQSWAWHADPPARRRDLARTRRLRALGWEVVELWWSDLERLDDVLADVAEAYRRQRVLRA